MGLFSFLSKNKEKDALESLSQLLGEGEVRHRPNDHVWEWRGTVGGVAARAQLGGPHPEVWVKCAHDHGSFTLQRDPTFIKDAGDAPEDAWSSDDVVRLFVGPGIFIESFAFVMPEEAAAFENLPKHGAQQMVAAMPVNDVIGVNAQSGEILLGFDPGARMEQVAAFVRLVAAVIDTPPTAAAIEARVEAEGGEGWTERRVRCEYCRCSFLLGADGKCPNCGAPA